MSANTVLFWHFEPNYIKLHHTVHVLMRDERKKQARSNKQAKRTSHLRQLIFSRKSDCLVCLFDLASFFLPSHLSFKNMYILGLVFGVIGGLITPAFSFILS